MHRNPLEVFIMTDLINNAIDHNGIPLIVKSLHVGDFIEVIYANSDERLIGGYVTTLTSNSPKSDKGTNKVYFLGISAEHPNNNEDEKMLWVTKIKLFRVVHK